MKDLALELIKLYQCTISRVTPPSCRFTPTCSQYGFEAIERFGLWKGMLMTASRLARCNPFNPGGFDPVPDRLPKCPHEHCSEVAESEA